MPIKTSQEHSQPVLVLERRLLEVLRDASQAPRECVAALTFAIARIADITDDNVGVADYLVQTAGLIRAGRAMEARPSASTTH